MSVRDEVSSQKVYPNPIVTEISKLGAYYPAEEHHQNYFNDNGSKNPYCSIIPPKIQKFQKLFKQYT